VGRNNGGGFFSSREELDAEVRGRFGDEVAGKMMRSMDRLRHPRRPNDREQAQLQAVLAPILRDMRATGAPLPDIVPEALEHRGEDYVCAWITEGDGSGCGIWAPVTGAPEDRVFWLAEQVAEWASDAQSGREPEWEAPT
jgi:hypothetical protein